jgi:hypothetical protein
VFFPPHFDFRWSTIISVVIVAVFLVLMERPMKTAAVRAVAPLTAIMAASAVVFGSWTIVLYAVSGLAIQLRFAQAAERWRHLLRPQTIGQVGITVLNSYTILFAWREASHAINLTPTYLHPPLVFLAVVFLGLLCQTVNNTLAYSWYLINGRPFNMSQLLRTGVVASIYGYLLVATFQFGGLLAAAVFYIMVAQIRVVQDILGITAQLHRLEKAQAQTQGLVKDLVRLTDIDNIEFSREVQNISQMIARRIGMSSKDIELLGLAAELHEIGKSRLPARIRLGTDLNPKEQLIKQTYSRWGGLMIRAADAVLPQQIADWIEFHGEHYDGSGYPRGLKGESIPLASRIIAVARDYIRFLTGYDGAPIVEKEKALTLLRERSGTLYDPRIVEVLNDIVS